MKTLTKKQMESALYASEIGNDPGSPVDAVNNNVYDRCGFPLADWESYGYDSIDAMAKAIRRMRYDLWQQYETGKTVLESCTMRTTASTTTLAAAQHDQSVESAKPNVVGTYLRQSGYIATSQVYDVVVFTERSTKIGRSIYENREI